MADVAVTAANVLKSNNSATTTASGTAGATITAGQTLYADSTDSGKLKPASASALASAAVVGIALHAALDEQPITYVTRDPALVTGATMIVGTVYVASATAGGIAGDVDILTGEFVTVLGVASTATTLNFSVGANMQSTIAHV